MRAVTLILMLFPVQALAFVAQNGMVARQTSPTEILVVFDAKRSDTDYWCAAGDLVVREMGLPVDTRLWRATPKPRGSGEGIMFTLVKARAAEGAGLSQFGAGPRDGSMSVGTAVGVHCERVVPFF